MRKTLVLVWGLACLVSGLRAQEFRGSVLGRVTDPSGAVVPAAKVRVTNVETRAAVEAVSNDQGNYVLPFLLPGNYTVSVEHPGFKKVERAGIRVSTSAAVTVDIGLEIGATTDTVQVNSDPPLLETASSDLGQVVADRYVRDVPLSFYRNAANFTRMAPGVVGQSMGTYTSDNQTAISISGGGGTQGSNEWILDGVSNTVPLSAGSVVFVPIVDAVEEMKVNTTMFDAEYGHSNGGAVSISTKSGTNQLHGTTYLFKRWAALYANTWSNDKNGVAKPPVNYHEFGYFVSGPVYIPKVYDGRNKTFFSTWFSNDFDVRDLSETARVPTALERAGNFSATLAKSGGGLVAIYNPFSTVVTNGKAVRQAFPNATIPTALLNPIGLAVANALPLPNLPGNIPIGGNNWYTDQNYFVGQKQVAVRIDHYFNERNRIFARYSKLDRDQYPDVLFPGINSVNGSGANLDTYLQWRTSAVLNDTYTFSPTFVGTLSYGFSRRVNNDSYGGYGLDPSAFKLPTILTANQTIKGFPEFNLGENIPDIGSRINLIANDGHSIFATFTKVVGNHTFKFGSDYRLIRYNTESQATAAAGSFTFSSTFTQSDPFTASTGNTSGTGIASLLLGTAASGSLAFTSPLALQSHYLALFLQDSWKLSRKLTISLGLRYELETPYTERYNRVSYGFDPAAKLAVTVPGLALSGGLQFAGVNGNSRNEGNLDTNNFGPRAGFAYQLFKRTVIRGGYALFYQSQIDNLTNLGSVGTFSPSTPFVGTTDSGATVNTTISNPFPNGLTPVLGSAPGTLAQIGNSLAFVNPNRVTPYNQNWQLSVQQELPSQIVVQAAYVGMLSVKELESYNLNDLPAVFNTSAQTGTVPNPFLGVFPSTSTLGTGATTARKNLETAFPQFTTLTQDGSNTGTTTYHALQAQVQKRMSHRLSVSGSFTFSKTEHNNLTSLVNAFHYHSIASIDQPKLVSINTVYDIPLNFGGGGVRRILDTAFGGWAVTASLQFNSGLPLSITGTNGRPIVVGNPQASGPIDKRLGDQVSGGVVQNPYFNVAAFQALSSQFVYSPQVPYISQLRAPGLSALNASLFKNFHIKERLHAEMRIEAYNLTNHPWFNAPGTNLNSPSTFGVITGASNSRMVTAGLKILF